MSFLHCCVLIVVLIWCNSVLCDNVRHTRFKRIVGGTPAPKDAFPWEVSIQQGKEVHSVKSDHKCGGALIESEWVITAAHCIIALNETDVTVVIGAWNISDTTQLRIPVQKIILHSYDSKTRKNDLALLQITAQNTTAVTPVTLPDYNYNAEGQCSVAGWGQTDEYDVSDMPDVLHYANLSIIDDLECENRLIVYPVDHTMLCAGGAKKDACQGDSGSPLICKNGLQDVLAGVVSWGVGCATPHMPGVYTEIAYFIPWIQEQINSF